MSSRRLTEEEKIQIRDLFMDGYTDDQIANAIKRPRLAIIRVRKRIGLKRDKKTGKVIISDNPKEKLEGKTFTTSETVNVDLAKSSFRNSHRYERLRAQLMPEELTAFMDLWSKFAEQFEEMTPSEEVILENMIYFQIRIDSNRKAYKDSQMHERQLREKLGLGSDQELDLENESDRYAYEAIVTNNRMQLELNKDFQTLTDKYKEYFKMMNSTREQREATKQVGADTFLSLVREFNNRDRREEVGKYNERMRLASNNQVKKMKKGHKYMDGEIGPVLLDGRDFVKKEDFKEFTKEESKENTDAKIE